MDFLKTVAEIITSLSVIIGALITIEKFTKGKLTQWIVKPVVEPINKRIDVLEEKSTQRAKDVSQLREEVEAFRNQGKEDMKSHTIEYDKTYLTDFFSELEQGISKTEIQKQRAYEIYEQYTNSGGNSYIHDKWEELKRKNLL